MKRTPALDPVALRLMAEARLKETKSPGRLHADVDVRRLQHELEVHQIELEMQNQDLVEAQAEVEELLERYTDLYDFAPVGYFKLTLAGDIYLVNLTGAKMLGSERSRLIGSRFDLQLAEHDRPILQRFLTEVFGTAEKRSCELEMKQENTALRNVRLEAMLAPDGKDCRAILVDITGLKQLERETQEHAILSQSTIDALSAQICVIDESGTILTVNRAWRLFAESNPPLKASCSFAGANYLEACDSATGPDTFSGTSFAAGIRSVLSGSQDFFEMEYACHSPEEKRWFVGRVTRFAATGAARLVVAHENITTRKLAEMATSRLAAIVTSSDDGIIGKNLRGIITDWNYGAEKIFGYTAREMVGKSILCLIPPDRHEEETNILSKISRGESVEHFETLRLTKDGRIIHVSVTASPIRNDSGKVIGVSKMVRDVTAKIEAEEAHRLMEERFQEVANHLEEVIWMTDTTGSQVLYISPAYKKIWGRTCESVYKAPDSWLGSVHPEDRARVQAAAGSKRVLGTYDETYRITRPDGSIRWIRDRAFPIRDPEGNIRRIVGTAADISEQRLLEEQFHESQKMEAIGTLAGGIAHDFNNILGAILGNLELARMDPADTASVKESLSEIAKASERAKGLVTQILTFSRHQPTVRKPLLLQSLLVESVKFMRASTPAYIEFVLQLDSKTPPILADATQMNQVFVNLLTNAWHALNDHAGRIGITLGFEELTQERAAIIGDLQAGPYARISVVDTGCGIPLEIQRRIFEPFFTTKELGKGTGLGLSVVHGIIRNHHGAITVASAPGQGSTFTVYFPVVTTAVVGADDKSNPFIKGRGQRVLLIDDEPALVRVLGLRLERSGFRVRSFFSPKEALNAFKAAPGDFELVITDYEMPQIKGTVVAAEIHQLRPELPVILCSGFLSLACREEAERADVKGILEKPVDFRTLLECVQKMV